MENDKNNPSIERNDFSSITGTSIFITAKHKLFEYPNELCQVFVALKPATSYSSQQCLAGQIQVQKPTKAATNEKPYQIYFSIISIDTKTKDMIIKETVNI